MVIMQELRSRIGELEEALNLAQEGKVAAEGELLRLYKELDRYIDC